MKVAVVLLFLAAAGAAGCSAMSAVPLPGLAHAALARDAAGAPVSCLKGAPKAADPNGVHGLMVWLDSTDLFYKEPAIKKYLLSDPNLCGASIDIKWSQIDQGPSATPQYNPQPVVNAMRPWVRAHKIVNLLFVGVNEVGKNDNATPSWVLAQSGPNHVDLVPCPNPSGHGSIGPPTPVYWEPGYKNPWHKFITAMIKQWGKNPNVGYMRFGLGAGAEDFPQHGADNNCFPAWQKYGLTGAKYWANFSAALTAFIGDAAKRNSSTVTQLVALNDFHDTASPFPVANEVGNIAAKGDVGFGTENLGSGNYGSTPEPCTNSIYWCEAFTTHAGQVPLEFQTIDFTLTTNEKVLPLPDLLAYALANHAQIFEIYPADWLTADDPDFATYPVNHRAWKNAFDSAAAIVGGAP